MSFRKNRKWKRYLNNPDLRDCWDLSVVKGFMFANSMERILLFILAILLLSKILVLTSGCAQIMAPTGGTRDSLPPELVSANPELNTTNFKGNRITLDFNEYIQLINTRENLLVTPTPKIDPYVDYKLRSIIIKLKDTLEPNTTYAINLGNAVADLNESNPYKNFTYVFSTGPVIDSAKFSGKVELAETGKADSTLIVMLYKDLDDSAVIKQKPRYISKLDSAGNFRFRNLAPGTYHVFALKDGDGSKTYNSKSELFAFADSAINVKDSTSPVTMFAYGEEREPPVKKLTPAADKKLKFSAKVPTEKQDILTDLVLEFNNPLKNFDSSKILLSDTLNNVFKTAIVTIDTPANKIVHIKYKWQENSDYELIIPQILSTDSSTALSKPDTIRFETKKESEYGSIKLTFKNFDKSKNPVLQFVTNNAVVDSVSLTSNQWSAKLFRPAEYELRILFDDNKDGTWTPGNYILRKQPEKVFTINKKINIKANWDNETDIELP